MAKTYSADQACTKFLVSKDEESQHLLTFERLEPMGIYALNIMIIKSINKNFDRKLASIFNQSVIPAILHCVTTKHL